MVVAWAAAVENEVCQMPEDPAPIGEKRWSKLGSRGALHCTVFVVYLHCICSVFALYLHCICSVAALYLCWICTVFVVYLHCICSGALHFVFHTMLLFTAWHNTSLFMWACGKSFSHLQSSYILAPVVGHGVASYLQKRVNVVLFISLWYSGPALCNANEL